MKSKGYKKYLKKIRQNKILVIFSQVFILLFLIILWQKLVDNNIINSFISSSPKNVVKTIIDLYLHNNLIHHLLVLVWEQF